MRLKLLTLTLALGLTSVFSQGPMFDTVIVNLPHPVTVRGQVLEPGEYVIKQLPSATNSRVLQIFKDNGMRLETTVMTIPALDNRTPEDTKVILHNFGDAYYFDKVWIQGKNYGYEFPVPDDAKSRMRERAESFTVAARYEPTTTTAQTTQPQVDTEAAEREAAAERERQAQAERDRLAQAERDRLAQEERDRLERERQAQAERDRLAQEERDRLAQAERDRMAQQQVPEPAPTTTQELPATSSNWLATLLAGAALIGAGLKIRRS